MYCIHITAPVQAQFKLPPWDKLTMSINVFIAHHLTRVMMGCSFLSKHFQCIFTDPQWLTCTHTHTYTHMCAGVNPRYPHS